MTRMPDAFNWVLWLAVLGVGILLLTRDSDRIGGVLIFLGATGVVAMLCSLVQGCKSR